MDKHTLALEALLIGFDFGASVKDDPMCVVRECAKLTDTLVTRFAESPPRASVLFECLRQALCDDDPASLVVDWITDLLRHRCVKFDDVAIDDAGLSFLMCCAVLLKFNALYFELQRIRNSLNEEACPIQLRFDDIYRLSLQLAEKINRFMFWWSCTEGSRVSRTLCDISFNECYLCCINDNIELYKHFLSLTAEDIVQNCHVDICILCNSVNIRHLLRKKKTIGFRYLFTERVEFVFFPERCFDIFKPITAYIERNDYRGLVRYYRDRLLTIHSDEMALYCIRHAVDSNFTHYFIDACFDLGVCRVLNFCVSMNYTATLREILKNPDRMYDVDSAIILSLLFNRIDCFSLLRSCCWNVDRFKKYAVSPEMRCLFE